MLPGIELFKNVEEEHADGGTDGDKLEGVVLEEGEEMEEDIEKYTIQELKKH